MEVCDTQSMYTIVLCLLYFPLIISIVLSSLIALFPNILTFSLESRVQKDELRMPPRISSGAV